MSSIYNFGHSIYNYFYPSNEMTVPTEKSPVDTKIEIVRDRVIANPVVEVVESRDSKIQLVQDRLITLLRNHESYSLERHMISNKTLILENLEEFSAHFFSTDLYDFQIADYLFFLTSEGFIEADNKRILRYIDNLGSNKQLKLIRLALEKKTDSNSLNLNKEWSSYIAKFIFEPLENFVDTGNHAYLIPERVELLKMLQSKTGRLVECLETFASPSVNFSELINKLALSDQMRGRYYCFNTQFFDSAFLLLNFAVDVGVQIAPANVSKMCIYQSWSMSTPCQAVEQFVDKYLSKQETTDLAKLAVAAYQENNSYLFGKIMNCDHFDVTAQGDGISTLNDLLQPIFRGEEYSSYKDFKYLEELVKSLNSPLTESQRNSFINVLVENFIIIIEQRYNYAAENKIQDICKLLGHELFPDFNSLKELCSVIEEKLGKHLASEYNKYSVGCHIGGAFFEHLSSSFLNFTSTSKENSRDDFFKHPFIQELKKVSEDSSQLTLYKLSLSKLLDKAQETADLNNYFLNVAFRSVQTKLERDEALGKLLEFIDLLVKMGLVGGANDLMSDLRSLFEEILDGNYLTITELEEALLSAKDPLPYMTCILGCLMDKLVAQLMKKLPVNSTYFEVKKQVEIALSQMNIDYEFLLLGYSSFRSLREENIELEGGDIWEDGRLPVFKDIKKFLIGELTEGLYEDLSYRSEVEGRNNYDLTNYSFSEMLQDLEEERYEKLCGFLAGAVHSYSSPLKVDNSDGERLIFKAIEKNNIMVVKELIELGYDPFKTHQEKLTAIEYAKQIGRSDWFIRYLESSPSNSELT